MAFAQSGAVAVGHADRVVHYAPPRAAVSWPYRVGLIPGQADCFQHRDAVDTLDAAMASRDSAVLCQVLSGTGGVGKTQLAAHYARRRWDAGTLDLLVWVTANSRDSIVSAYAHAGIQVAGAEAHDPETAAQQFLTWMETTDRTWLVILDDVDDPGSVRGLWPPRHPTGRVVVTTRRRDASLMHSGRRLVPVGLFTLEESVAYLTATLAARGRHDDPDQIQGLAKDLGCLPLALAQAIAYLIDRGLDCSAYRKRFADRRRRLAEVLPEEGALPDEQRATVATTWSLSIELADDLAPRGLARPMLQVASMLDANGIPTAVLTTESTLSFLSLRRDSVAGTARDPGMYAEDDLVSEEDARDALHSLHRLNLADITPDAPERGVRIHGLIQRATRDQLDAAEFGDAVQVAAQALLEVWPKRGVANHEVLRRNTQALRVFAGPRLWGIDAHPVLFRVGMSLRKEGLVVSSGAYWRDLHTAASQHLGPDHSTTLRIRRLIAKWQEDAGDLTGAVTTTEDLLAVQLRVLGADHADTLSTRRQLVRQQERTGNLLGAVDTSKVVLSEQLRVLGSDHPDTLAARRHLALRQAEAGNLAGAVAAAQELLVEQMRLLGPNHRDTLANGRRIIQWRKRLGAQAGALTHAEELIVDRLRESDPDHVDSTGTSRRRRRRHRRQSVPIEMLSERSRALAETQEFLAKQLHALGPDHPEILKIRGRLAEQRAQSGDRVGAVATTEELLAEQLRLLGPDHVDTLATRDRIARLRKTAGDLPGAVTATEVLLTEQLRVLGPDHPSTLATRGFLADRKGDTGDRLGAVAATEELLTEQLRALGPDHVDTLATRDRITRWREAAGDLAGAVAATEELLAEQLRVFGPDHGNTLATRRHLLRRRGKAGDRLGAQAELQRLFVEQLRALGPDHHDTVATGRRLARRQEHAESASPAVIETEKLLVERLRVLGPDHRDTLATRRRLAEWQGEAGDPSGALASLKLILSEQLRALGSDHYDTLKTRARVAHWQAAAGDRVGALATLEALLSEQSRVLGSGHPDTFTTRMTLAHSHKILGDSSGALTTLKELLTEQLRMLGPDHRDTLAARVRIAQWQAESGDHAGALTTLEILLSEQLRVLGPDHVDTQATRSRISHWRESIGASTTRLDRSSAAEPPNTTEREGRFLLRWRAVDGSTQSLGPFPYASTAQTAGLWAQRGGGTGIEVIEEGSA